MQQSVHTRSNGHSELVADAHGPVPTFEELHDLTLDELTQLALQEGVDLSQPRHQQRMSERAASARKHAPAEPPKAYVLFQRFMVSVGNAVMMAVMLVIQNLIMPLSVAGLAYAEKLRVQDGINQFDAKNANVLSIVAIGLYLGLLVVYAHNVDANKVTSQQWSVRLWWQDVKYVLGIGRNWRARKRTSEETLSGAIAGVGALIIFLGTYGSLHDELLQASGADAMAWYDGLWTVATGTALDPFLAILGGLILTAALLRGLKWVVGYNYDHFVKLVPESVDFLSASSDTSELEEEAKRQYVLYQIAERRKQSA